MDENAFAPKFGAEISGDSHVTKWVTVAEVIDLETGAKTLVMDSDEESLTHDIEGLLRWGLRSVISAENQEDDGDEGEA